MDTSQPEMLHSKSRAMSTTTRHLVGLAAIAFAAHASAQVTFYSGEGFRGPTFQANSKVWNLERFGFNDRASSAIVEHGRWEVCEDAGFRGRCVVLRRGNYDSLSAMGLNNQISSVRPVENNRSAYRAEEPVPAPVPAYEWRRRPNERTFEVPVTSVRAVMGPPEQRCWVERQSANEPATQYNVPGAVIGGVVGGILGHQIGGGSGKALATIGGVAGGAAVGANVGRNDQPVTNTRDIRRCENVGSQTPQYYDVTYDWRGTQHHVQMTSPPAGRTILVNGNGEPRS
jgi:uncharacterized protein YcfJ